MNLQDCNLLQFFSNTPFELGFQHCVPRIMTLKDSQVGLALNTDYHLTLPVDRTSGKVANKIKSRNLSFHILQYYLQ